MNDFGQRYPQNKLIASGSQVRDSAQDGVLGGAVSVLKSPCLISLRITHINRRGIKKLFYNSLIGRKRMSINRFYLIFQDFFRLVQANLNLS
jgi:hypothetical protein